MRKKFKVKKRFKIKYLFYIFLIYISFVYTFYFSIQKISDNNNKKFINLILSGGNTHLLSNYKVTKIVNETVKLFTNIDLTKPLTVINQSIFKNKNSENIIKENHEDDYSNLEELKKIKKSKIENFKFNNKDLEEIIYFKENNFELKEFFLLRDLDTRTYKFLRSLGYKSMNCKLVYED